MSRMQSVAELLLMTSAQTQKVVPGRLTSQKSGVVCGNWLRVFLTPDWLSCFTRSDNVNLPVMCRADVLSAVM